MSLSLKLDQFQIYQVSVVEFVYKTRPLLVISALFKQNKVIYDIRGRVAWFTYLPYLRSRV